MMLDSAITISLGALSFYFVEIYVVDKTRESLILISHFIYGRICISLNCIEYRVYKITFS